MTYLDPVQMVREMADLGVAEKKVAELLAEKAGYLPQARPLSVLIEALFSGLPLLVEGPAGAGKTALAQALATTFEMPLFRLSCAEGLTRESVLYRWNREAQRVFLEQETANGRDFNDIQNAIYTRQFLDLAPVTAALDAANCGKRPILLIDEIDKINETSDLLLEPLAEFSVNVEFLRPEPRIQLETPDHRPVVILTSNNIRHGVSSPLRNRALYTYIETPVLKERIKILFQHGKGIRRNTLLQLVVILEQIATLRLTDPPGLRNGTRLAKALSEKKLESIGMETFRRHLCYLSSNQGDLARLETQAAFLFESSLHPPLEIREAVDVLYDSETQYTDETLIFLAAQELETTLDDILRIPS
jgi:MoxR-like ATPase